jgi:site-specific DNA-adenine methylase
MCNRCELCGYDYLTGKGGKIKDTVLRSPYPYFGSKLRVVREVWRRFGRVHTYIEPFLGSAAVAINSPDLLGNTILNDLNGYICNFWRAVQADPQVVAKWADWPITESDQHARHRWLMQQDFRSHLDDPHWFDAKIAGWWAWGQSIWIGSGWCDPQANGCIHEPRNRPVLKDERGLQQQFLAEDGGLARKIPGTTRSRGLQRHRLDTGCGGDGRSQRMSLQTPFLNRHTQPPLLRYASGVAGNKILNGANRFDALLGYFTVLQAKLRAAKVCCGDWSRVLTPVCWAERGTTAIFLDPPYSHKDRDPTLYGACDSLLVARKVANWAVAHGTNPNLRIAVCGYDGEHDFPADWSVFEWKATRGYTKDGRNSHKERIWFSPACVRI